MSAVRPRKLLGGLFEPSLARLVSCACFILVSASSVHGLQPRLAERPYFTEPIANVTVPVGREAVLSCVVENLSMYKVAWLRVNTQTILTIATYVITKNHRILATHSDHHKWYLHIREVQVSDAGDYMCQINTDPMINQIGFLNVVVPPNILDDVTSTDVAVREGSNVTLSCAASGSPTPSIAWKREGSERMIPLAGGERVSEVKGPSLSMSGVTQQQMGAYLCIATNGVPPSVSKRILLEIYFPPRIRVPNQQIGAQEGQEVVLECFSEANPRPHTRWSRGNDEISNGKNQSTEPMYNIERAETGFQIHMKLIIRAVQYVDYGTYRCSSKNDLGVAHGEVTLYHIPTPTTTTPRPTTSTAATTITTAMTSARTTMLMSTTNVAKAEKKQKSRQRVTQSTQVRANEISVTTKSAMNKKDLWQNQVRSNEEAIDAPDVSREAS